MMFRYLVVSALTTMPLLAQPPEPKPEPARPADAAAQAPQDRVTAKPVAGGPGLVIHTSDADLAEKVAEGADVELPALAEGQHWVFTMDDGGKLQVKTAAGAVGKLRLEVRPRQLMETFAEQVEMGKQQAQMMGGMMLAQGGMKPKDTAELIDFAFDLPKQIETLTVNVDGSKEAGFQGDLAVQAVAGTWAGKVIAGMQAGNGAPQVPDQEAPLRVRSNLTTSGLEEVMKPFANLVAGQGAQNDEERKENLELMRKSTAMLAGPFSLSLSPQAGGMLLLMQLTDGKAYNELITSQKYRDYAQRQAEANPAVEIEFEAKSFEHNGVVVSKVTADLGPMGGMNPLAQDGKMEVLTAVAGDYVISGQFGATQANVKNMIDKALQNEIATQALPGGALMTAHAKVAALAEAFMGGMGMSGDEDMPETIEAALSKEGATLKLKVKVK